MSDIDDVLCDRCGKKMDGPATGIGYWCNDLKCGDEALLKMREDFEKQKPIKQDVIKDIATEFYYHWHNASGSNTQQGFDDWWEINKKRFIS